MASHFSADTSTLPSGKSPNGNLVAGTRHLSNPPPPCSPLAAAFSTYSLHDDWFLVLIIWLFSCASILILKIAPSADTVWVFIKMSLTVAIICLGFKMGGHLKYLFVHPQARLMPGFATAHLFVAKTIIMTAVLLESLLSFLAAGISGLAMASFSLFAIVVIAGLAFLGKPKYNLAVILCGLGMVFIHENIIKVVLFSGLTGPLLIFLLGFLVMEFLARKLVTFSEESPSYSQVPPSSSYLDFKNPVDRQEIHRLQQANARANGQLQAPGWRDHLCRFTFRHLAVPGALRRLQLQQLATGFSDLFLIPSQFAMVLILYFLGGFSGGRETPNYLWLIFCPIPCAVYLMVSACQQRQPSLVRELLFPMSRKDFVDDLLRYFGCHTVFVAIGHSVALLVIFFLFLPQVPPGGFVLACMAGIFLLYPLAWVGSFWLASFGLSSEIMMFIMMSGNMIGLSLHDAEFRIDEWYWMVQAASVIVILAICTVLYRRGRRRWLTMDSAA